MPAGRGDGDRPLGHLLPADVGVVDIVAAMLVEQLVNATGLRLNINLAVKEADRLRQTVDGDHLQAFDHRRFGGIGRRDDDATHALEFGRRHGHRKHAFDRSHGAIEG